MNGLVLTTTVHTQLAIKSMVEKLRQNERGASALEYVGMLLVGTGGVSSFAPLPRPLTNPRSQIDTVDDLRRTLDPLRDMVSTASVRVDADICRR
jgi:hypothetical protein